MTYITFASMLILAASAMFSLYEQLKVLQNKNYSLSKYFNWIFNSYVVQLAISAVMYCAIMFFVLNKWLVPGFVASVLLLAARVALNILSGKKSEEKLVFSTRIKRFYIISIIFLGIVLFVSAVSFTNVTKIINVGAGYLVDNNMAGEFVRTICILLSTVTPVLTVVAWLVDSLIEKLLGKGGKKTFKHDLKSSEENYERAVDSQEEADQNLDYKDFINSYVSNDDDNKGEQI